ncbi:hypothetical protein M8C21_029316, partial [Ambrosia artemisiifolia]
MCVSPAPNPFETTLLYSQPKSVLGTPGLAPNKSLDQILGRSGALNSYFKFSILTSNSIFEVELEAFRILRAVSFNCVTYEWVSFNPKTEMAQKLAICSFMHYK